MGIPPAFPFWTRSPTLSIFTPPSPPARVPAQIEFTPADSTRRRHPGARSQRTAHSRSHAHAQRTYRIGLRTPSIYTYRSTSARHTLVQASRTCGAPRPPVAGSQIPPWAMRSVTARTPCLVCTNAHIRSTLNINSTGPLIYTYAHPHHCQIRCCAPSSKDSDTLALSKYTSVTYAHAYVRRCKMSIHLSL